MLHLYKKVKISNNLGGDAQYLVLVSSAPSKAKLSNGPTRMHIQNNRFCLTIGVPPKLVGLWDISYLRLVYFRRADLHCRRADNEPFLVVFYNERESIISREREREFFF